MYSYQAAIVLPLRFGAQWEEADVSSATVSTLYRQYREVILTLDRDGTAIYVSMNSLRAGYATYENTVSVLLQALDGQSLETLARLPTDRVRYVRYEDAIRTHYRIKLSRYGVITPDHYPRSEKRDLVITRPDYDTDVTLLHTHCLMSVNGFYHQTGAEPEAVHVLEGGLSAQLRRQSHVGITSFLDIGPVQKLPFTPDQISAEVVDGNATPLRKHVLLTMPESVEGKSFFLVLGGYLVFPEADVFWQAGENTYYLDMEHLPYIERLLESRHYLDLSPLGLTPSDLNDEMVNLEEAWSDDVLRKYLLLSQTFFVIVDTPQLFTQKKPLRSHNSPGVFTAYQEPRYPLFGAYGRGLEYWKVQEDTFWAVTVTDSFYRNYLFNRQRRDTLQNVTEQLAFDHPFHHSQGFLLEIGAYSLEEVAQ